MTTITTRLTRFAAPLRYSVAAIVLMSVYNSPARAEDGHSHTPTAKRQGETPHSDPGTLIRIVRDATERFRDVRVAEAEGYALQFGCVSGGEDGAMGLHYVNGSLVGSGILDATRPQIVIYEPTPSGELKLIGADYLVLAEAWNKTHSAPPELMGQLFHLFESPNRFGLPAFYTLHVWAWKENPKGAYVNWHPDVSCNSYAGQTR